MSGSRSATRAPRLPPRRRAERAERDKGATRPRSRPHPSPSPDRVRARPPLPPEAAAPFLAKRVKPTCAGPSRIAASAAHRCRPRRGSSRRPSRRACASTRAGAPTISEPSGNSLPSVTSAPAPTSEFFPIVAPLSRIAPMPIRLLSPTLAPCRMTLWPITQSRPITIGKPGSVCSVALSWICERSPSSIHSLSPRSTEPNQTLASVLSRTRPITVAVSAIQ